MLLTCHVAEYMMFKDEEEDTEVPVEISLSDSVIDFSNLEESKNKIQSDIQSDNKKSLWEVEIKELLGLLLIYLTHKMSVYTNR